MVQFVEKSGRLVCVFGGRMDTVTSTEMEDEVCKQAQGTTLPVAFDLEGVDYVTSMFLRVCMRVVKDVGKERFSIIHVHPAVKKVFKIAGFDREMNIE